MNEDGITQRPEFDDSGRIRTGVAPRRTRADSTDPFDSSRFILSSRWYVRLIVTTWVAAAFLAVTWVMGGSVFSEPRMLAGPLLLLRTWSSTDALFGVPALLVLLPCMFAVGVWRNALTVVLAIIGSLSWLTLGLWLEIISSV